MRSETVFTRGFLKHDASRGIVHRRRRKLTYLLWALPALIVIVAIASGKIGTLTASLAGLATALAAAFLTAPQAFDIAEAITAVTRGVWIGWIVVPYILGGLIFWQVAFHSSGKGPPVEIPLPDARAKRRLLFFACFLIGPFAESATGFGVGIIGTMMLIRRLQLPPIHLLAFALMSQTMILWGAMGSGAIVAAAFARTDPTTLSVHSSLIYALLNACWLPLYWRLAAQAAIGAPTRELVSEALWLGAGLTLAIGATALLGPEIALLAAYGPLIVLRFLIDERPDSSAARRAFLRILPFALLIGWLVLTRLVPPLDRFLIEVGRVQPFAGAPAWSPLFHAGSWLIIGGIVTAILRGYARSLAGEARAAWKTGRLAVLSILTFSAMAEVLSGSGIAAGLAEGMFQTFGRASAILMPLVSAAYGALANSGNAANGLFMPSQVSLAVEAGLNVAAVIALQHAAALSLNMISPVRMSIVCSLAGTPGREREAWQIMMPFTAATILALLLAAILVATGLV